MNGFMNELRFALLRLRESPGSTAVVVAAILALIIGANVAVFRVVNLAGLSDTPYQADGDQDLQSENRFLREMTAFVPFYPGSSRAVCSHCARCAHRNCDCSTDN